MRYTEDEKEEIFQNILANMRKGLSLRKAIIATNEDFLLNLSSRTFYDWIEESPEKAQQYACAREDLQELIFDEIIEIADDKSRDIEEIDIGDGIVVEKVNYEAIQRSRLRTDVRKWYLSKLAPKKFGDRLELDAKVNVKDERPDFSKYTTEELEQLEKLLAKSTNEESTE